MDGTSQSVAEVLFELKLLTPQQWQDAVEHSVSKGISPEEYLIASKSISSDTLTKAKAIALKVPYVDLKKILISDDLKILIPEQAARNYQVVAFGKSATGIKVAFKDPHDYRALEYLQQKLKQPIEAHIANPDDITGVLNTYSNLVRTMDAVLEEVTEEVPTDKFNQLTQEISLSTNVQADSTPVVQLVNNILDFAVKNNASDVHIEPLEEVTRVRMRVDGILQEILSFPRQIHPAIISRIKIMANLKIDEKRIPQDGRITIEVNKKELDLRVSTLPTIYSEKLVIRILTKNSHISTLEGLGLKGHMLELANQYFNRTNGMFLVTGPTGSGKTTTLYAALMKVNTPQTNTITLEDPVENIIFGVNQMQINPQAGLTFSSGLRSIVRQDPDIIMVGEIRDSETADLAVNAALTGHLVFSTLHTNNAAGAITRLVDIGIEPFLISSTVNIIIAQRLVRKVCHSCREAYTPAIETMESIHEKIEFFFSSDQRDTILADYPLIPPTLSETHMSFFRGNGCGACRNTGYKGRTAIFEVLEMSDAIRELTMKKSSEQDIMKQAVKDGMLTLMQEGILKVLEGTTTFEEVLRVAQ